MESWSCRVASALRGIDIGIDARWKIKFHLYCSLFGAYWNFKLSVHNWQSRRCTRSFGRMPHCRQYIDIQTTKRKVTTINKPCIPITLIQLQDDKKEFIFTNHMCTKWANQRSVAWDIDYLVFWLWFLHDHHSAMRMVSTVITHTAQHRPERRYRCTNQDAIVQNMRTRTPRLLLETT